MRTWNLRLAWLACGLCLLTTCGWQRPEQRERLKKMAGPHTWVSTTGNWGSTASWDTGVVPISAEVVYFDGTISNHPVTSGLDQTGVDLQRMWVLDTYTGNIGTPSEPLIIDAAKIVYYGGGTMYWSEDSDTDWIMIDSPNLTDAFHIAGGTPENVWVRGGYVTIDAAAGTMGTLAVLPSASGVDTAYVYIPTSSGMMSTILQSAGTIENYRNENTGGNYYWIISGGEFIHQAGDSYFIVVCGGRLEYNSTGAGTAVYAMRGTVDFSQDRRAKTISVWEQWPGTNIVGKHDGITFSNPVDLSEFYPIW